MSLTSSDTLYFIILRVTSCVDSIFTIIKKILIDAISSDVTLELYCTKPRVLATLDDASFDSTNCLDSIGSICFCEEIEVKATGLILWAFLVKRDKLNTSVGPNNGFLGGLISSDHPSMVLYHL